MISKKILKPENTLLLVIDVQEKLLPSIADNKLLVKNISRLIRGFQIHNAPVIYTEQYPKGLGKTVEPIAKELAGIEAIEKLEFSCFQNKDFLQAIKKYSDKQNIVICGIEAHVCVLQTCLDAIDEGYAYNVHFVADAISSRKPYDCQYAFDKMKLCGVMPSTVEMALFELTHRSKTDEFKKISNIAKEFTNEKTIGFKAD